MCKIPNPRDQKTKPHPRKNKEMSPKKICSNPRYFTSVKVYRSALTKANP